MKKAILLTLFFWGYMLAMHAQQYTQTIRGTIVDKTSQSPLAGANIVVLGTQPILGTCTDANGNFEIKNVPTGRINLEATYIGYLPAQLRQVLLNSGKELVLKLELEENAITTEEIVIIGDIRKSETINKMTSVSARSFSVEETERYAGSLGDPSRMASNFAGVTMTNDSRNDIIIRGNSPAGLLWRIDGIEIPNPNHFGAAGTTGGPVSMLNNNLLTRSDFFTSAFPAEYGNAMSGVFDLKMRTGNAYKHEFVGQVGFNGFELGAEGPFKKGSPATFLVNYRYSTLGLMSAIGFDFGTGAAIPQYQDITFKIDIPTKNFGRFSMFGMGGVSYIELHDSENDPNDADNNYNSSGVDLDFGSDMAVLGLSHQLIINENTRLNTYASVQGSRANTYIDSLRYDSNFKLIPSSNYFAYTSDAEETKYAFSTHLRRKLDSKNNIGAGVFYEIYQMNYLDSMLKSNSNPPAYQRNFDFEGSMPIIRAYAQWQHKFSNIFTVNSGIYTQYVEQSDEITFEPRVNFKYQLNSKSNLSAGYGLHSQAQGRVHYFTQVQLSDGSYKRLNENLGLSKSHQSVLGYDFMLNQNFRIKAEGYYQYLFDIPVTHVEPDFSLINTGDNFGIWSPDSMENIGSGENYGVELTLERFLSNNYYFLSTISVYESTYKGYNGVTRNTAFANNYILNVLGGYEFVITSKFSIALDVRLVYAGGKRYVPIDLQASVAKGEAVYEWSEAYEQRYDDYFRTDARLSFKQQFRKLSQEFAVDFQNLTNYKNVYSQTYNVKKQSIVTDYQTGFYPMFLYRINF